MSERESVTITAADVGAISAADVVDPRAARIAVLRTEREALNLGIRAQREKLRALSDEINALEYEEREERLMARLRRPAPKEVRMKVEPGKMKFKPKR